MESLIAGPPAWYEWDGAKWYFNAKDRYYRERNGFLLHIAVWVAANGPIPDGYEVHHVDHDRAHNDLGNLVCITAAEHREYHALVRDDEPWCAEQTSERARERVLHLWATRKPRKVVCAQCGEDYWTTGMRAKLCSPECRKVYQARVARERRARRAASGKL